ncbi:MAG: dihydropteroate synthase [Dehalococcoidales bacterium]|nr:dihydropteroate synthase [Dehalococcoidales bacterium]
MNRPAVTKCGNTGFHWGQKTYVMGIINTSPESFSGDGLKTREDALEQARRFISEGADILDIGGESTRPGLDTISAEEELERVIPVIEYIAGRVEVPISVDTTKPEVARQALKAGASILNDQWGLKKEPELAELAAARGVPIILMSNQRDIGGFDSTAGRDTADYEDVMTEVISALRQGIETAVRAGVPDENIIIDPGIGFGKTWQQDIEIIRRLAELDVLGKPVLLGTSRKSAIKMVLKTPANDRVEGTAATVALGIAGGADIVRVHDVKQMVRVCRMTDAIVRGVYPE